MGPTVAPTALVHESQSLVDAEPVLFVYDNQGQIAELNLILKQGVGPDHQLRPTAGNGLQGLAALARSQGARQPGGGNAQGFKPCAETLTVLLSQQFSGRHDGGLPARSHGMKCSHGSHHRLAAADISLEPAGAWAGAGPGPR